MASRLSNSVFRSLDFVNHQKPHPKEATSTMRKARKSTTFWGGSKGGSKDVVLTEAAKARCKSQGAALKNQHKAAFEGVPSLEDARQQRHKATTAAVAEKWDVLDNFLKHTDQDADRLLAFFKARRPAPSPRVHPCIAQSCAVGVNNRES